MDALTVRTRRWGFLAAALVLLSSIAILSRADSIDQIPIPVQQEQLKRGVDAFASNPIAQSHNDASPERRNKEVCPLVAGLNKGQGEFILARLSQIAKSAGAPLGDEKCNPNFFCSLLKGSRARAKAISGSPRCPSIQR